VYNELTIFTGTAKPTLAATIACELDTQVGACVVDRYPDGDIAVKLLDSVRRKEVFLVQPTLPPVNDHLVELLALADARRRSDAFRITAIVPFFGYGRADKRHGRREPIMARVVADLLEAVGISHIVTVDLHTPQIEGFFHAPVDSLTCRANPLPGFARSSARQSRRRLTGRRARRDGNPLRGGVFWHLGRCAAQAAVVPKPR
jgi:ribose-phosphate pyrophosphokinase